MISILIPVFNAQVHDLVQELSNQLVDLSVEGEILVYDDFSEPLFKSQNDIIKSIKYVSYRELNRNYGRIEIRKLLASDARYNWLLFIDSDSAVINPLYLKNYLQAIADKYDVYTGGRVYESAIPPDCSKRLHWKYGRERESLRGNSSVLHTNNFCIRKQVFVQLSFPRFTGYGHEDTWLQIGLEKASKKICFINNPVLHTGLEVAEIFLEKTKSALKNLLLLAEIEGGKAVKAKVSLYKLYLLYQNFALASLSRNILKKRIKKIEENLKSCNPSLFQFDLYRLYYLLLEKETMDYKKG